MFKLANVSIYINVLYVQILYKLLNFIVFGKYCSNRKLLKISVCFTNIYYV